MGAVIRYADGRRVYAVLLIAGHQRMRVAIPSEDDSVELFRVGEFWVTERGDTIEIESLMQIPGVEASDLFAALRPRGLAAGSGFTDFWLQSPEVDAWTTPDARCYN